MSSTRKIGSELASGCPLKEHIQFFGEAASPHTLTYSSMQGQLASVGEGPVRSRFIAATVATVGAHKMGKWPFQSFLPEEAVCPLRHAQDTRIYRQDGTIDEDTWRELLTFAEDDNGVHIITKENFDVFLESQRMKDTPEDNTWPARQASNGEWGDFWNLCTDYWKNNTDQAVTIATLRDFFEDSKRVFSRCQSGELPVAQPAVNNQLCRR